MFGYMSPERKHSPQDHFEKIIRYAKEALLRQGSHGTMLIMEGDKNTLIAGLATFPATHAGRIITMRAAGRSVALSGEIGRLLDVYLISEGWMSMSRDGKLPNMRPSQDPNRKEVLIISGLRVEDQSKSLRLFEMKRGFRGKLVDLEEVEPDEGKKGTVDVPLLEAFVDGFQVAFRERTG